MGTLADTLHEFHAAVEDYRKRSPHLRAYAKMLEAAEEADRVLGPAAAGVWEEVLKAVPGDPLAEHHLAIIRHGTGYRLHADTPGRAKEAVEEWKRGMQHWARLVNNDAFWDALRQTWEARAARAKAGADPIGEKLLKLDLRKVRAHLPRPLLALHAGFAEDCAASDAKLAKLHVAAIKESGFHPTAIEDARKRVYRSVAGDVVKLAADLNTDEAWTKLRRYLAIDADYPAALADALRICTDDCGRRQGDAAQLESILKMLREAEKWAEDPALVAAARTEFALAEARSDFYLAWTRLCANRGIDLCNKDKPDEGLKLIDQAFDRSQRCLNATTHPSPAGMDAFHWVCREGAISDLSCNRDKGRFPLADRFLTAGLERLPDDPVLHAIRAKVYYWTGDESNFRRARERAEELNRRTPTPRANSHLSELKQYAARGMSWGRIAPLISKADKALGNDQFSEALKHLAAAEKIDANILDIHFYKFICHLQLGSHFTARQCLTRAEQLLGPDSDPNIVKGIATFRRNNPNY